MKAVATKRNSKRVPKQIPGNPSHSKKKSVPSVIGKNKANNVNSKKRKTTQLDSQVRGRGGQEGQKTETGQQQLNIIVSTQQQSKTSSKQDHSQQRIYQQPQYVDNSVSSPDLVGLISTLNEEDEQERRMLVTEENNLETGKTTPYSNTKEREQGKKQQTSSIIASFNSGGEQRQVVSSSVGNSVLDHQDLDVDQHVPSLTQMFNEFQNFINMRTQQQMSYAINNVDSSSLQNLSYNNNMVEKEGDVQNLEESVNNSDSQKQSSNQNQASQTSSIPLEEVVVEHFIRPGPLSVTRALNASTSHSSTNKSSTEYDEPYEESPRTRSQICTFITDHFFPKVSTDLISIDFGGERLIFTTTMTQFCFQHCR